MNGATAYDRNKKILTIAKLILLVIIVAGIPAFLYFRYGAEIFSKDAAERVVAYLKANERIAALLIIGIQILQVIICILPGQPIQFAASYMFGVFRGLLLSLAGAVIGAFAAFYIAKILGSDAMHLFFGEEKVKNYQRKLNSGRGLMIVLLIYLIPGVPKDLVAYVAGISEMKVRPFLIVSTIGRCPGMAGSLLLGHFYSTGNYRAIVILCIVTAVILILCFIYRKKMLSLLDRLEESDANKEAGSNG